MHLVVDVLALRVEALEDLRQHVDGLLAAQARALGLELLQQVFGGHRLADQVAPHRFFGQLHITGGGKQKTQNYLQLLLIVKFIPVIPHFIHLDDLNNYRGITEDLVIGVLFS